MIRPAAYAFSPAPFVIDWEEWTNIFASMLAMMVALSLAYAGLNASPPQFIFYFLVFALAVGPGFVLHELAHKHTAIHYGARARFEPSMFGLALMLALAVVPQLLGWRGIPIFLAPGAVMIYARRPLKTDEGGRISLAGPLTNIALGALFVAAGGAMGLLASQFPLLGLAVPVMMFAAAVNIGLAWFNLWPIPPLDGAAVAAWNWPAWLGLFIFTTLLRGVFSGWVL